MKKLYLVLFLSAVFIAPECCAMKRINQALVKKYLIFKEFGNKHVGNEFVGIPTLVGGITLSGLAMYGSGDLFKKAIDLVLSDSLTSKERKTKVLYY